MRSSNDRFGFLRWRMRSLNSLGTLSVIEIGKLWLPASKRPKDVYQKFLDYENDRAKANLHANDEYFMLFGKKFYHKNNFKELEDQIHEIVELDSYWSSLLPEGAIVVDAGAMLGVFSVTAAQKAKHVYSFEPSPYTFEKLAKTAGEYTNITVANKGLGATESVSVFHIGNNPDRTLGGNSFSRDNLKYPDEMEKKNIPIVTIDSLNLPRVDCIKIDTEGYEKKILMGAMETIKRDKPMLMVSAYHNPGDKEEIPRFIRSLRPDYDIKFESEAEENFICT